MSLQESLLRWKEKGIFLMVLLIRKNVDVYCISKNEDFFPVAYGKLIIKALSWLRRT